MRKYLLVSLFLLTPVVVWAQQPVQGIKTSNTAAPSSTNIGVLPCIGNASTPVIVEGNQVGCSTDLHGSLRVTFLDSTGSPITLGQKTMSASFPVVFASDQSSIPVTNAGTFAVQAAQFGTWTMQPGNTANTTPWLFTPYQNSATLFPNAGALGDGASNPTTTGIGSYNMCWNGATWDRCKAATGGNGTTDANTARVTLSSDSTGQVKTTNFPTTVTLNSGASDASTLRVANDPFWGGSLVKGTTASMTGTTSTSVIGAVASNYIYVTQCVITQSSTSVGTAINLQDGSGGTTLYTIPAPAAANSVVVTGAVIPFPSPIKVTTLGNALYAADVTTGSAVILSCSGFASTVSR